MSNIMKLKKRIVFSGICEKIPFEIHNWEMNGLNDDDENCWAYYIFLSEKNMPKIIKKAFDLPILKQKRTDRKYYDTSKLPEIFFHHGITWFSKENTDLGNPFFKIGCDYQHYWDVGIEYDKEMILNDVRKTVSSYLKLIRLVKNEPIN